MSDNWKLSLVATIGGLVWLPVLINDHHVIIPSLHIIVLTQQLPELLYVNFLNIHGIDSSKIIDIGAPCVLEDLQLLKLVTAKVIAVIIGDFSTS